MAIQQVNVYVFNIELKSKHDKGSHIGERVLVAGATLAAAQSVLQQQFGNDLVGVTGGNMREQGVYTTLA